LHQTVTGLVIGQTYQLSFYQAAGQEDCLVDDGTNCDPQPGAPHYPNLSQQWQVTFGSSIQTSTLMITAPHGLTAWNAQTMTFTATATSQVLSFLALGTPNGGPPLAFLDGITLNAVPEPGTSALLGLGLLMLPLGGRLLKRRFQKM
jgi:hypothetical protein